MQIGVATTHMSMLEQEKQNMQPTIIKPPSNLSNAVTMLDKLPKIEDVTPSPSPPIIETENVSPPPVPSPSPPIIEHIEPIPPPIIDLQSTAPCTPLSLEGKFDQHLKLMFPKKCIVLNEKSWYDAAAEDIGVKIKSRHAKILMKLIRMLSNNNSNADIDLVEHLLTCKFEQNTLSTHRTTRPQVQMRHSKTLSS